MAEFTDVEQSIKSLLLENIRSVKDFPKPEILFKVITHLLNNAHLLKLTSMLLAKPFWAQKNDRVAGLEFRGFLFGTNLAQDLHAGFIPIRKPRKLPAETEEVNYELEYGTDLLEIHSDAIEPVATVLIHDDLIATGGSTKSSNRIDRKIGRKNYRALFCDGD